MFYSPAPEGRINMSVSHCAVDEDSEQFASQCFQQLSIVELTQGNLELQDVVFQNGSEEVLVCWDHVI